MGITERIDRTTLIPEASLRVDPPAPRSVKIELSPRCNYRCGFCALRTRAKQPQRDMSPILLSKLARELVDAGVQEVGLFYLGESFMAHDLLVSAIRTMKEAGVPYVFLTSNASLASPERVEACMEAGLDSLKWSVNAANGEQFASVMGARPEMFELALRNIAAAWSVRGGYSTRLYASSILYDDDQPRRMEALLADRVLPYVDEHYWLPLYSMGSFAAERERELGFRPTAGNQGRIGALRAPLPCWAVFTEGHVTADGKLSACCFDADGKWSMGDLAEQAFLDAWHSDAFRDLRAAHLRKDVKGTPCEACVAYA